MSGGSWNYFYIQLEEVAERLAIDECPHRKMFAAHLEKCAEAMRSIEWVDSGDYGPGRELEDIAKCFDAEPISDVIKEQLIAHRESVEKLLALIESRDVSSEVEGV